MSNDYISTFLQSLQIVIFKVKSIELKLQFTSSLQFPSWKWGHHHLMLYLFHIFLLTGLMWEWNHTDKYKQIS